MSESPKRELISKFFQEALHEPEEAAQALVNELMELQELGRYNPGQELASGGMKQIQLTEDKMTARVIAMALPRKDKQDNESLLAFVKEARLTAQVEHPNIVPVHEIGVNEEGMPYYTMKYIEGDNLGVILSELKAGQADFTKKYSLTRLLNIFIKVCDAVAFAHSKNIVHLDLKPDNILVGLYGQVQVCDWGLAQHLDDISESLDGKICGTPGYLAPEQIKGCGISRSSDIFALGSILYQLLTYEQAFSGPTLAVVLDKTLCGVFVPMKIMSPKNDVPEVLELISAKCLNVRSSERYHEVNELLADIEAYQNNRPTQAQDPGVLWRSFLLLKRHKTVAILSMIALVILMGVSFYFTIKVQEEAFKRKEVSEKAISHYNELTEKHMEEFEFEKALDTALTSVRYKPSDEVHWDLTRLYIYRDDLNQAEIYASKIINQNRRLMELIVEFKTYENRASDEFFLMMVEKLIRNHYPGIVNDLCYLRNSKVKNLEEHLPFLRKLIESLNPKLGEYQLLVEQGGLFFKTSRGFTRLSPFANLPVHQLILNGSDVRDLFALSNMEKIDRLEFADTMVNELKYLVKIKINYLDISNTVVTDIRPLLNAEVSHLVIEGIKIRDLSFLNGYEPLKSLKIDEARYRSSHDLRHIRELKQQGVITSE